MHRIMLTLTSSALLLAGCAAAPVVDRPSTDPCVAIQADERNASDAVAAARDELRTYLTVHGYASTTISDADLAAGMYAGNGIGEVKDRAREWTFRSNVLLHVVADNPACFDALAVATAKAKLGQ